MYKLKHRKGREEHPKRNSRQTIALLLILTLFLTVVLSGCLGSEKKNGKPSIEYNEDVFEDLDLAIAALASTKQLEMDTYSAFYDDDFEKTIELEEETKLLYLKSLNHSLSGLNKTTDPTLTELFNNLVEANNYFIQSIESDIQSVEFYSKQDYDNAKIAGDKASDLHVKGGELERKVIETILEDSPQS